MLKGVYMGGDRIDFDNILRNTNWDMLSNIITLYALSKNIAVPMAWRIFIRSFNEIHRIDVGSGAKTLSNMVDTKFTIPEYVEATGMRGLAFEVAWGLFDGR